MQSGSDWSRSPTVKSPVRHTSAEHGPDLDLFGSIQKVISGEVASDSELEELVNMLADAELPEALHDELLSKLFEVFNDSASANRNRCGPLIRVLVSSPGIANQVVGLRLLEHIWQDGLSQQDVEIRLKILTDCYKQVFAQADVAQFLDDAQRLVLLVLGNPDTVFAFVRYLFCFVDFQPLLFERVSGVVTELMKSTQLDDRSLYFVYWICWKAARVEDEFARVAEFVAPETFGSKEECLSIARDEQCLCALMGLLGCLAERNANPLGVTCDDVYDILSSTGASIPVQSSCLWLLQRIMSEDDVYDFVQTHFGQLIQLANESAFFHVKSEAVDLVLFIMDKLDDKTALDIFLQHADAMVGFLEVEFENDSHVSNFLCVIWNAACTAAELGDEKKREFIDTLQSTSFQETVTTLWENPEGPALDILTHLKAFVDSL